MTVAPKSADGRWRPSEHWGTADENVTRRL